MIVIINIIHISKHEVKCQVSLQLGERIIIIIILFFFF